jgi:hypothetical protein
MRSFQLKPDTKGVSKLRTMCLRCGRYVAKFRRKIMPPSLHIFYPEDVGIIFTLNVRKFVLNYTVSHPKRR